MSQAEMNEQRVAYPVHFIHVLRRRRHMRSSIAAVLVLLTSASVASAASELIVNGGFETGTMAGWTVHDSGNGSFVVTSLSTAPHSNHATVGPKSGMYYAVSGQTAPGVHAIRQAFSVPGPAQSVILSFDMFVSNWDGGPYFHPNGLDHSAYPNQHARVDILTSTAGAFDTGSGVLQNFFLGGDPVTSRQPYILLRA
jgi:hypothetical protein